jgi:predicted PurR-regulated permease PerM
MPHALSSSSAKIILTTEQSQLQQILEEMNNLKAIIDDPDKKNDDDVKNQVDNIINFITRLKTQQTSVKTGGYMTNKLQPYNFEFIFIITLLIVLSLYLLYLVYSYHGRSKRIYQIQQSCQIKSRQGKFKSATDNRRPKNWPEIQSESQPVKKIKHPYVI